MASETSIVAQLLLLLLAIAATGVQQQVQAGIIKDLFHKVTNTNEKTDTDVVKQSVPVCGSGLFSTPNEAALSPELILITNRRTESRPVSNSGSRRSQNNGDDDVALEYRFNVDNVTIADLEEYGFNRDAPTSFIMHGFTSGYPLQGWMTGIVQAYTIERESDDNNNNNGYNSNNSNNYNNGYSNQQAGQGHQSGSQDAGNYGQQQGGSSSSYDRHRRWANSTASPVVEPQVSQKHSNDTQAWNPFKRRPSGTTTTGNAAQGHSDSGLQDHSSAGGHSMDNSRRRGSSTGAARGLADSYTGQKLRHNLFIINWNYAARGILYPRAVANIPIVASYATRFINNKLLGEAQIQGSHIQLIGHSLGAHLAGFIGKNTKQKMGRIYGLDPAGPCFGAYSGFLYPKSKRLAPSDALEVITIQTNSALLGIDKPLGRYSVYVEGGEKQPGCKGGGVIKSISTITFDGGDFDTVACSHGRAPNLLTHSFERSRAQDSCQMVAYECKDWQTFTLGQCGVCKQQQHQQPSQQEPNWRSRQNPLEPVQCIRIGLDWQYSGSQQQGSSHSSSHYGPGEGGISSSSTRRPINYEDGGYSSRRPSNYESHDNDNNDDDHDESEHSGGYGSTSRRPSSSGYGSGSSRPVTGGQSQNDGYNNNHREEDGGYGSSSASRRPSYGNNNNNYSGEEQDRSLDLRSRNNTTSRNTRTRRANSATNNNNNSSSSSSERRLWDRQDQAESSGEQSGEQGANVRPISMFLRTGDTQPYCTFHYQVVLELNEPFNNGKAPHMTLILQDSRNPRAEKGSLSNDEFGHKFNERLYTHLLTSVTKLGRIERATMLFRDGLPAGPRLFKALHVSYMSNNEQSVRERLSSKLCPVELDDSRGKESALDKTRFYFEPCGSRPSQSSPNNSNGQHGDKHGNNNLDGREHQSSAGGSRAPARQTNSNSNRENYNNQNNNPTRQPSGGYANEQRRPQSSG